MVDSTEIRSFTGVIAIASSAVSTAVPTAMPAGWFLRRYNAAAAAALRMFSASLALLGRRLHVLDRALCGWLESSIRRVVLRVWQGVVLAKARSFAGAVVIRLGAVAI